MRLVLNVGTGVALAWLMGISPFSGPASASWDAVRADLAAARPQARLAVQAEALLAATGVSRPASALMGEK